MNYSISDTAEYGGYTRGPRIINSQVRREMRKILREIQTGKFAMEWIGEATKNKQRKFFRLRQKMKLHPIEKIGEKLRKMMPFIKPKA